MIVVHHLNNSRSQRILWLLEELGLEYELKLYYRDPKTMLAPQELKNVHPLGKSPVVTDGAETVAESGAIIEYLLEKYGSGRLKPAAGTVEARRFTYFLHYAEGSTMPPLLLSLIFGKISGKSTPALIRPIARAIADKVKKSFLTEQLRLHFDFCENELSARPWFAGQEFTAADIQMSYPIEAAKTRVGFETKPHLQSFLDRIHARPAYQRALARGGPFST
jgi:glutathione S-transferase